MRAGTSPAITMGRGWNTHPLLISRATRYIEGETEEPIFFAVFMYFLSFTGKTRLFRLFSAIITVIPSADTIY
jgi:hypothetical protein